MPTAATRPTSASTLYLAFDLGNTEWKLAFTTGPGHAPRIRTMPARDLTQLYAEVAVARERFALPEDAVIVSCYERSTWRVSVIRSSSLIRTMRRCMPRALVV